MRITFSRKVRQADYVAELESRYGSFAALRRRAKRQEALRPILDEWAHLAAHAERADEEVGQTHTFVFHDPDRFFDAISAARFRLYDYLRHHPDVASVRDLAQRVGRNYRNVYQDVHRLADFGLVDLERLGNRPVPHVRVHEVEVVF